MGLRKHKMAIALPFSTRIYVDVKGDGRAKFPVYQYPNINTVRDLKNAIHDIEHGGGPFAHIFNGSWVDAVKLRCNGQNLDSDSRTLASYGVKEDSKVMCEVMG